MRPALEHPTRAPVPAKRARAAAARPPTGLATIWTCGRASVAPECTAGQKPFKPSGESSKMVSRGEWPWRASRAGGHTEGDASTGCQDRTPSPAIRSGSEDDPMAIQLRVLIVEDSADDAEVVVREVERR